MLPSSCRLTYLISRFIKIKLLNLEPEEYPFDKEALKQKDLEEDDPFTIAFHGFYNGTHISDGFYNIEVDLVPNLKIQPNLMLKVYFWTVRYRKSKLQMTIIRADVVPTLIFSLKEPTVSIEDSPVISQLLQAHRYYIAINSFDNNPGPFSKWLSQNPTINIENPLNINEQEKAEPNNFSIEDKQAYPIFTSKHSETAYSPSLIKSPEKWSSSSIPLPNLPSAISSSPIFASLSPFSIDPSSISFSDPSDIEDLDIFPPWALAYLKLSYKIWINLKMEQDYDYLFKLLLIGDSNVGKTSVLLRYVEDTFNPEFQTTIGVDFKITTLELQGKVIKLQLWDTAGQDRFRNIVASYYRGAQGIVLMYDITNTESFKNINRWFEETQSYLPANTPKMIIGNKVDLASKRTVTQEDAQSLADRLGVKYIETSAKNSVNIRKAFETMSASILEKISKVATTPSTPGGTKITEGKSIKKGCCA
ncbi:unnamed protein product [Blepharisma stoltei]|uniref:Uncharacterized protein n=1 Tax=Blepharisma stoltei TaxID=1481888 RepID=A0AAU9K527_9CILI|nr:unnamed protein product [Blepharisma stoltei]